MQEDSLCYSRCCPACRGLRRWGQMWLLFEFSRSAKKMYRSKLCKPAISVRSLRCLPRPGHGAGIVGTGTVAHLGLLAGPLLSGDGVMPAPEGTSVTMTGAPVCQRAVAHRASGLAQRVCFSAPGFLPFEETASPMQTLVQEINFSCSKIPATALLSGAFLL